MFFITAFVSQESGNLVHRSQFIAFKKSAQVFSMTSDSVSEKLSFYERIGFNSTTNSYFRNSHLPYIDLMLGVKHLVLSSCKSFYKPCYIDFAAIIRFKKILNA